MIYYQIKNLPKIDIYAVKGSSYRKRWKVIYNDLPFPFFSAFDVLLWEFTFEVREHERDSSTILSLNSIDNAENIIVEKELIDQEEYSYHGLYLTNLQTDIFSLGRKYYLIRLKRISDNWTFKLQKGNFEVIL